MNAIVKNRFLFSDDLVKIALIMHELLVEGGGERQCVSLARELSRQGHEVTLYTCAYDRQGCFPQICESLDIRDVGRGRFRRIQRPRVLRGYLDMLALAARVRERPEVWNPHHWPAEWGAVRLKKKLGGAVVWMCNDVPNFHEKVHAPASSRGFLARLLYRLDYFYDRAQTRKIDLILFLSHWAENQFKAIYPARSRVVRSGADPDRFTPGGDRKKIRSRFGYSDGDFVVLWLGIVMPHRRLQDAIEAVAKLRQKGTTVKLLLAGSGQSFPEYLRSLQQMTRELGLEDRLTFAGKVPDAEMRDFYCACDLFLFPNENQTWGLAVLEAMSCGRPVLVSRGAAVHEILTDGKDAVLFPARDTNALAEKLQLLYANSGLREEIARNGMDLVRSKYNWEQFAHQVTDACEAIICQKQL